MKNRLNVALLFVLIFVAQLLLVADSFAAWKKFVGVKFGIEKYNCMGFGICLIYDTRPGGGGEYSRLNLEGDQILLEVPFSIAKESPDAFNGDSFFMEQSYEIPLEISGELGSTVGLTLAKGKHPMERTDKGFRIKFDLRE